MVSAALAMLLAGGTPAVANEEIQAPGPDGPLQGTLVLPAVDSPIVLMIPGSGPTDRDGNNPLGVNAAPYRLLAEGLAEQGIGSVRIDKRGMFGSQAAVADANAVTLDDYVHDTGIWVDAVRARTGATCVWLLGHSEGGLVALASAAKTNNLCGLILVATAGRPLGDVLKEQLQANPANTQLLAAANHAIDELSAGRLVETATLPPELMPLFNPDVQRFLISTFALDPAELAGGIAVPLLIAQGQTDLQVSGSDAERIKQAAPDAELAILPDTNHVMKQVGPDDRDANLATYAAADLPLAPGVVDSIASFIKSH
ncbi:lysophospholipase [Aureimonas fodinaquatilis]|uniref:Lysophospholipase n=2 Tax=Aureimonas fodinaquatilis TaxID=2565783 RepID=A0A5B0DW57_9HYPH|nr:lysophospholipase [Aureimonas fodinaquatilis]